MGYLEKAYIYGIKEPLEEQGCYPQKILPKLQLPWKTRQIAN